jgi:hypothetical protein
VGTARAEEFRNADKQVNGEDEKFAQGANVITTAIACKTARHRRIPSTCESATDRLSAKPTQPFERR